MVERRQQDPGPEPDAIGRCCQRGQPGEQRRHVSVPGAVVLADPRGIESEGLGQPNHVQDLPVLLGEGPVRAGGNLGGEEPDPDLSCHRGQTLPQWIADARSGSPMRSEEHTSELQSRENLVCRLLLEKKKNRYCVLFLVKRSTQCNQATYYERTW